MNRQPTSPAASTPSADALARLRRWSDTPHEYKRITRERAVELTSAIVPFDDDATVHAFIELLHGIVAAAFDDKLSAEDLVTQATLHAYARTMHANVGFDEFVRLNPEDPRDSKVLMYSSEPEGETVTN